MEKYIHKIGVTGTGSLIGQAIIKSIQRSNLKGELEIIGFDYFPETVGSFWCKMNFILPDILKDPKLESLWLDSIVSTISFLEIRLMFVGVDFELPLFAKYKTHIEHNTNAIVLVSSTNVVSIADDKYLTYRFLKENNLSHPKSWLPNEIDFDRVVFPLIVKPRKGARSRGVKLVKNIDELKSQINLLTDPIIQEYIGDDENEFTCGVVRYGDITRIIVLKRKLKDGNTFISIFSDDFPESILMYLAKAADLLNPLGACNFQLRIDANGIPKIFEINSRHSGTTYIRTLFGFNEVEFLINLIIYRRTVEFNLTPGKVVRYYEEFLEKS